MKHADRVTVHPTVQEQVTHWGSRPLVVMLDGKRVGDFDDATEAGKVRLDIIHSLDATCSFAALRERFENLAGLHAKLSAEYQAIARECGEHAETIEDEG